MMINREWLETLVTELQASLPDELRLARGELHDNLKAVLQGALSRLDLVSRSEFEAQQAVLLQTRRQLEQLEQQIAALEAQLPPQD